MKKLLSVLCACIFCFSSFAQEGWPTAEEISEYFFRYYELRNGQRESMIALAKKKEGCYLLEYDTETNEFSDEQLFWSAKKGKYVGVSFPVKKTRGGDEKPLFWNSYSRRDFNVYPYYGYTGWESDVIDLLRKKRNKTAYEWNALGYAYSRRSGGLLTYSTKMTASIPKSGDNLLSPDQLQNYINDRTEAVNSFRSLCDVDPTFNTVVGSGCLKADNEYLTWYVDMKTFQNDSVADLGLVDGLYNSCLYDFAWNILNSCEEKAILFTSGDNDTYPLIYLQEKLGIRTDVTVVNMSLLNLDNYANRLREELRISVEGKLLSELDYLRITTARGELGVNELISKIGLEMKNKGIDLDYSKFHVSNGEDTLVVEYKPGYIFKGELLVLDIINQNSSDRPINFRGRDLASIAPHLNENGYVYTLAGKEEKESINSAMNFLLNEMKFEFRSPKDVAFQRCVVSYQGLYSDCLAYLSRMKDGEKFDKLLDKYTKVILKEFITAPYYDYIIAGNCFEMGNVEEGKQLADRFLNTMYEKKRNNGVSDADRSMLKHAKYHFITELEKHDQFLAKKLAALKFD